jgi:hypothetical protein
MLRAPPDIVPDGRSGARVISQTHCRVQLTTELESSKKTLAVLPGNQRQPSFISL